jgi:tRNA(Ile)-lysidine synthetase-like protein
MNIIVPTPGTYVVGVSGGVDSIVLLDILYTHAQDDTRWKLLVAHLDHGIRSNSLKDRQFVQGIAHEYGLPFIYSTVKLGAGTSEARARAERYAFLNRTKKAHNAQAVITAHHQDDRLETAIINMVRGSGRKGITSLASHSELLRPLLNVSKAELISYAQRRGLTWREDSTNTDDIYLRNYIRHNILPRFDDQSRSKLLVIIDNLQDLNLALDTLLVDQLQLQDKPGTINRLWFNSLPHAVAREALATWLRARQLTGFDSKTLERLVVNAKAGRPGQQFPVPGKYNMKVKADYLALEPAER